MVLIVDDNKMVCEELEDALEDEEIKTIAVHNVDDFFLILPKVEGDLFAIIMDHNLEDRKDGIELFRYLKEERFELFQRLDKYYFSANAQYISRVHKDFLIANGIEIHGKETFGNEIIDSLSDKYGS